jgi:hypothetical protein
MPNAVKWSTPAALSQIILGASVTPTMKALASNGQKLGSETNGETGKDTVGDFLLKCKYAVAAAAGGFIALYIIEAVDAAPVYADGDDSIAPPATAFVGQFPVRAVATAQVIVLPNIRLPPFKWKPLIVNKGGQALTNVDGDNGLWVRTYNQEIQ